MVHHLFSRRRDDKPDFPTRADLPALSQEQAAAALEALRDLVAQDLAHVYTRGFRRPGERWRFNVWLGEELVPPGGERLTLDEWAMRFITWRPGGDAS